MYLPGQWEALMADNPTCIVVCTDDSGRYAGAVSEATSRAVESGATVILYDVVAPGRFTTPRPNEWAGEGEREVYDRPLDPIALEKLGRHDFAVQVEQARAAGADAYGWLPDQPGGAPIAEYAAMQGAQLILVPSAMEDTDIVGELREATNASPVEVTVV
jgi:nucleotide-binding universal stress UspA family protein